MLKKTAAMTGVAVATVVTLVFAAPAFAAPWDGNDFVYGPGEWELDNNSFTMDDVYLVLGPDNTEYTDLWDGAGSTSVFADSLGLSDENVYCSSSSDVDLSFDGATGNPVATCEAASAAFASVGLDVVSEIRVLTGGEIVRFTTTLTNTTDASVTIDEVVVETNFGSQTALFDYENQSDDVLPVPYEGNDDVAELLNSVGAQWAVNFDYYGDAPGGIVIGGGDSAAVPGVWSAVDDDDYIASFGPFSVPSGESRSIVTFATWDPQTLIDGDYNNTSMTDLVLESAAEVVAMKSQFASLTASLAVGLDPQVPVINWGPMSSQDETPEESPELAETGPADALVAVALAAILIGVGVVAIGRRRRTA